MQINSNGVLLIWWTDAEIIYFWKVNKWNGLRFVCESGTENINIVKIYQKFFQCENFLCIIQVETDMHIYETRITPGKKAAAVSTMRVTFISLVGQEFIIFSN